MGLEWKVGCCFILSWTVRTAGLKKCLELHVDAHRRIEYRSFDIAVKKVLLSYTFSNLFPVLSNLSLRFILVEYDVQIIAFVKTSQLNQSLSRFKNNNFNSTSKHKCRDLHHLLVASHSSDSAGSFLNIGRSSLPAAWRRTR